MMNHFKRISIFIIFYFFLVGQGFAQIVLPALIRDSMVLQREVPLRIWGSASPGEKVRIRFNGRIASSVAGPDGKWLAKLPAMKAGGPFKMQLNGKNSIVLKDILIGDVWLCSGQSNMVHQMRLHNITYTADIAAANYPEIRQYWVPAATGLTGPKEALMQSYWRSANPADVNDFSAVAYFFARQLYQQYRVPIGIINASVGGTPIEAWISEEGLKQFNELAPVITRNKDTAYVKSLKQKALGSQTRQTVTVDKGLTGDVKWYDTAYVPKGWKNIHIPGYWEDQGIRDLDGVVWYRREFEVPAGMTGKPARILMGRIVDADSFYINGRLVGNTGYQYPQRRYVVAPDLLKPGKNTFVIRVQNMGGKGGFVPDKPYVLEAGDQTIDLKGDWQYKVGESYRPVERSGNNGISEQVQPTALYNAMIAPLTNYALKGALWYQGESNTGNAKSYKKLLTSIIADWRTQFDRSDLPFFYVQLPNYGDRCYQPSESGWAVIREAALQTLELPNTGMAVTIDLGEWNDIHPDNKKDVGERLALVARHSSYGEKKLVYSGPLFRSSKIEGNQIIVSFDQVGSGLIAIDGEPLSQFAIAGEDKKFVWANARIDGDKVVVSSAQVSSPKYVRYGWADNPADPNLYNAEKLPASPFRTDK